MRTRLNAVPAALRSSGETSRFAMDLMKRAVRPVLVAGPEARAAALAKSKFARRPEEPEDARLTGATRSLARRLMALNVMGSLRKPMLVPVEVKMA